MYSGCTIRTIFEGTSITLVLKEQSANHYTILIDNQLSLLKTNNSDTVYKLAENLPNIKHQLEIIRNTEWSTGNTVVIGLRIDKEASLNKPIIKDRKMEFIGDSYTCGYGINGKSHDEHFSYETENNYISYGAITARNLEAEYTAVCRSGIGMFQGYGGDLKFTQPLLYDEIIQNATPHWDYNVNPPQIVIIELGTNDVSVSLDEAKFIVSYQQFIEKIKNNYPKAKIVCAAGPNSGGDKWFLLQKMIHRVVNNNKQNNVYYFEFSNFIPNGSDWHPNAIEHQKMAMEFTSYIKNLMKW
jgi:lysophospholipase L1-like esterase